MNILLVDNKTKHLRDWQELIEGAGHRSKTISFVDANSAIADEYDLTILTGGTGMTIPNHRDDLAGEISLIKDSTKPILGVCFGFQLIADTFGAKLLCHKERVSGIARIEVTMPNPIFGNIKKFGGFEAHKYYVKKLPANLIEFARSDSNIEVFRHNLRPIYGFQFHPEVIKHGNDGAKIFLNLLRELEKSL